MRPSREKDVVDVHVTSISERVDAFSQYPLLAGDKRYTVEVTEFVCPLAGQGPLPSLDFFDDDTQAPLIQVRRKRLAVTATHFGHDDTRLNTLPAPLGVMVASSPLTM